MNIPKYEFDSNILLFNLADVHRGDHCCNVPLWHKVIKYIEKTENAFWISTGDLLNVAVKTSLSDVYKSNPLEKEYEDIQRELGSIRNKCLGFVSSNHHARFERAMGISLDKLIADALQIPFLGHSGVINIALGQAAYYVAMHHGVGGGRKRGGKVNNALELASIYPGADLYCSSHTHAYDFFPDTVPYIDRKRNNMVWYNAYFSIAGHFLDWKKSYGEEKMYKPLPVGASYMKLHHRTTGNFNRKKIIGDLFN